jgi:hypothetical protein
VRTTIAYKSGECCTSYTDLFGGLHLQALVPGQSNNNQRLRWVTGGSIGLTAICDSL